MRISLLVFMTVFFVNAELRAAKVDTLEVQSTVMQKKIKIVVAVPDAYRKSRSSYPVLYLLHGGSGSYKDWLSKTPDKSIVKNMADQYNLIIVMPDAGPVSYYFDSPRDKSSQYETFITKEVIAAVDNRYRTLEKREGRVIAGLSMGGHGALFLSTRHPDLYCAAGSMSGVMNINTSTWKVPNDFRKLRRERFEQLLGEPKDTLNPYPGYTLVTMTDDVKKSGLKIIFDCGVDDFLIEPNRDFHHKLLQNGTPHDYIERPGGHTWEYWQNALPYQMIFFVEVLKSNGSLVVSKK